MNKANLDSPYVLNGFIGECTLDYDFSTVQVSDQMYTSKGLSPVNTFFSLCESYKTLATLAIARHVDPIMIIPLFSSTVLYAQAHSDCKGAPTRSQACDMV